MIRTFKYPLEPNRRQAALLADWLERCRVLYNVALEQRREWWRMGQLPPSDMSQTKDLTELRADNPSYGSMPVEVSRSPLRRLQRAFEGFFRRLNRGRAFGAAPLEPRCSRRPLNASTSAASAGGPWIAT